FRCRAPLAAGEEETAHAAPGYPVLLAALQMLPVDVSERTVRWIQCVLGTLTAGFYFLFARRAFRHRIIGALTGFLCAVHPFWIVNTAEINDGILATFLLAACIGLGARGSQSGGALTSLLYGLGLASLALVRAATLPFAFIALLWFLLRCRSVSRGWLCAVLAVLGFVNGLAPWTLRNYQVFGEWVPIVDSAPYHLCVGRYFPRMASEIKDEELLKQLAGSGKKDQQTAAADLAQMNQVERYRTLGRATWENIQQDIGGEMKRRIGAGLSFFVGGDGADDTKARSADEPRDWWQQNYAAFLYGSLFGMLLLGVLGWRWTFGWRRQSMPASLAVMWITLPYILTHAEAWHGPRLPLDGIFLCYAAFAVVCLIPFQGGQLLSGPDPTDELSGRPDRLDRAAAWR
ncbi:MAG TPA: glycosyltransferase family 39 protein, partial [Gemmataceae bacterium]|nr:glycosyltransferase family 39 protein [Gemmataceae bacterium]